MSMVILRILLALGILGHGLNFYCDRILSIFPNGRLMLANMDELNSQEKMAKLMDGVSAKVPMRSAILGVFALFLQALGYFAISAYVYEHSAVYGSVLFFAILLFIVVGTGHHVKCGFAEYVFLRLGRDKKAHTMMLDLFHSAPITRICYLGYIVFIITLITAILTGTAALPLWAAIFTILPIFIILFPFKIIGTLHISAMVSMLAWMILI